MIDPDLILFEDYSSRENMILDQEIKEGNILTILKKNALLAKIDLEIYSPVSLKKNQITYFNYLLPLKEKLLQANFHQEISTKRRRGGIISPVSSNRVFEEQIILDSDLSWLKEEYNTKYFMIMGLIGNKNTKVFRTYYQNLYFIILLDIERAEVMYREVRKFNAKHNPGELNGVLFDSFNLIKKLK
ncbi:MAG: hypothetical protein AAF587_16425 [Bacteroidota bacterium]